MRVCASRPQTMEVCQLNLNASPRFTCAINVILALMSKFPLGKNLPRVLRNPEWDGVSIRKPFLKHVCNPKLLIWTAETWPIFSHQLILVSLIVLYNYAPCAIDRCKYLWYFLGRSFPSFPNEFVSKLEWNDHAARKSLYMEEYVSDSNNIGAVFITGYIAPGIVTKYITQASTKELFVIYGK